MTDLQLKKIIEMLFQSIELLEENDLYLIEHSVHEQDLSHRIAHYFENLLNNYRWYKELPLNVDVEYNKNFDDSKKVYLNCYNCDETECYIKKENYDINNYQSPCKPDIILHQRGSNRNNILVIEIKKNQTECAEDFAKLSAFTCTKSKFKYKRGVYINIADSSNIIFRNGQKEAENDL